MLLVIVFMCTSGTGMLSGWSSLKLSKMSAKKVAISINVVYNDDIYSQESLIYSGETTLLPCKLSKPCQFCLNFLVFDTCSVNLPCFVFKSMVKGSRLDSNTSHSK